MDKYDEAIQQITCLQNKQTKSSMEDITFNIYRYRFGYCYLSQPSRYSIDVVAHGSSPQMPGECLEGAFGSILPLYCIS